MALLTGLEPEGNGPYFSFEDSGLRRGYFAVNRLGEVQRIDSSTTGGAIPSIKESYAIANEVPQPIPEPLTILGTITFGGFMVGMKKRKNHLNAE